MGIKRYKYPLTIERQELAEKAYPPGVRCTETNTRDFVLASDYAALEKEHKGLLAQHARDSAELRSLCQARDDARRQRDAALLQVEALRELLTDWAAHFTGPKVIGGPLSTLRERTDAALQAKP